MAARLSSRERMLAAIRYEAPDYVPCSFMLFGALRARCADELEFVQKQIEMGLDAFVELGAGALSLRFDPRVEVRTWRRIVGGADNVVEGAEGERLRRNGQTVVEVGQGNRPRRNDSKRNGNGRRYPVIHREYVTPAGTLRTSVNETDDWPHGLKVPLFDDYAVPRAQKHLVTGPDDLPALRYLFTPPTADDLVAFREHARVVKSFAARHGLPVRGGWGMLFDVACWLCGIQDLVVMAATAPDVVRELLTIIQEWNRRRMEVVLEAGVDLLVRRAWYEMADFLSPESYRRLILPFLKDDVQQAHEAGAALGLITTTAYTPLLDMYLESGMDVLIGPDPVQETRADFPLTKRKLGGRICLWGGVNGYVTVETGTAEQVRQAVRDAIDQLGPGGGFILSPVDNVTADNERVWDNVSALLDEWHACRAYPV